MFCGIFLKQVDTKIYVFRKIAILCCNTHNFRTFGQKITEIRSKSKVKSDKLLKIDKNVSLGTFEPDILC